MNGTSGELRGAKPDIDALVARWADRLQVQVKRVQIRTMRTKWGSISTAGVLTLADDILHLPPDLAEYIVVHELMHLRYPDHQRGWRVSMGMYLPDWRDREATLRSWRDWEHVPALTTASSVIHPFAQSATLCVH